ncbi:MAG: dihydropteroate synthase [Bryobacteraceae bacterium]
MARKHYEWKVRDKMLPLGQRTLIVGILNVTPDSFSDGGKFDDPDRAFARAIELEEEGADIIDIGAESTRPGSERISEAEELRRLVPVLKRLRNKLTVPISVDTYKSGIAEKALDLGVDIINDPSGLTFDAELAAKVAQGDAGLILNHMRGTPESWAKLPPLGNPVQTVAAELEACAHRAVRAGVDRKRILVDPGLGFGKRKEQNSEILALLDELARLELPIMVGPSRKQFLTKETLLETDFATAAAVVAAILHGAHLVRVHDVKMMKAVVEVADEIANIRQQVHEVRNEAEAEARAAAKAARREGRDVSPESLRPEGTRQDGPRTEVYREARRQESSRPGDKRSALVPPLAQREMSQRETPAEEVVIPEESASQGATQQATEAEPTAPRREVVEDLPVKIVRPYRPAGDERGERKPSGFRPAAGRPFRGAPEGGRPGGRSDGPRTSGGRPGGGRYGDDRSGDRPYQGRSSEDRPSGARGGYGRPGDDRPSDDRPREGRPSGGRPGGRPGGGTFGGGRFGGGRPGGRPGGGKPGGFRGPGRSRDDRGGPGPGGGDDRRGYRGPSSGGDDRRPSGPTTGRPGGKPGLGGRPSFGGKPGFGKSGFGDKPRFGGKPGGKPGFGGKKTGGGPRGPKRPSGGRPKGA